MKKMAWGVFLAFILVSAAANFAHGDDRLAGALMAVVPIGFAAVITLLENMVARGKGSWPLYLAAGIVALGAGVASYVGLATMAMDHQVPKAVALLLPLAYDGVVAVASLAIRSLGSDHTDLGQPAQVSHHQSLGHPAQEMAHTPAHRVAHESFVTPVGHPGPATEQPVGHPDLGQVAHDETAGQRVAHEVAQVSEESAIEVAQDDVAQVAQTRPKKVAQAKPRATRGPAQKATVGQSKTDPAQLAQAVEAVRSGRLTQRTAATEYGVSRATLQRAMDTTPTVEKTSDATLEGVDLSADLDAQLAEILGRKNDDET